MEERLGGSPCALSGDKYGILTIGLTDFGDDQNYSGWMNIKYRNGVVDFLNEKVLCLNHEFHSAYKNPLDFYMFALRVAETLNLDIIDKCFIVKQTIKSNATPPVTIGTKFTIQAPAGGGGGSGSTAPASHAATTKSPDDKKVEVKPNVQNTIPGGGAKVSGQEGKSAVALPVGPGSEKLAKATNPNVPPVHKA